MRVDSHDMYRKIGFFDPESGIICEAERSEVDVGSMILCGHYSRAGGMLVVFYRVGEGLRLWLAGRDWAAEPSLVSWSKKGSESSLEVRDRAGAQAQIRYQVEGCKPYDDTPFAEDEDFDFGLYVINVLNDPGRRARIYQELFAQYVNANWTASTMQMKETGFLSRATGSSLGESPHGRTPDTGRRWAHRPGRADLDPSTR